VEADRCYFCHDAPCTIACPTDIDIPMFIRQIAVANPQSAAETIFAENIFGGMCARVCPTETLCEEACVREAAEGKPVKIGELQRYATDHLMAIGRHPFERAAASGRRVAVVGAGPAGLSCAHRLAVLGHDVIVLDSRPKPGGLNEFGIAAYKAIDSFAAREVDYILSIGGITVRNDSLLGRDMTLASLREDYDAVFLAMGLGGVNAMNLEGESAVGVQDAVAYIAELRQAGDLGDLPVGHDVVVVGGGMTAIDIASQSRRLGAENVTIVYRRGPEQMGASAFERELAQTDGVKIKFNTVIQSLNLTDGAVTGAVCEYTERSADGALRGTGETFTLAADSVFKAIGQTFRPDGLEVIDLDDGRIKVAADRATSLAGVWAGGDCAAGGEDLTVVAVQDGKIAAQSIDRALRA
ncbi:MAG: NAD(P)-dependent oxidoreductase, partial [Alphaproteobacteria bacterium]